MDVSISVKEKLDLSFSTTFTKGLEGSTLTISVVKGSASVESATVVSSAGVVSEKK